MKNTKPITLIFIIALCLLMEGCLNNEVVAIDHSATETAMWSEAWDAVFATQTQMASVSSEPTHEVLAFTPTPQLTATPSYDEIASLQCETYLKTTWGDKPEQWGYSSDMGGRFSLLPVAFNSEDEIYFSDFANLRLLKYDGINKKPVQIISLASFFPDGYVYSWHTMFVPPPGSSISIFKDKIYVPYGGNQIGILSLDGDVINNIVIPDYYYDYNFPTIDHAWVDDEGNLFVFWRASFKAGWENHNWVEINESTEATLRRYSWNDYLVVQDGISLNGSDIIVYEKDTSGNLLQKYAIPIQIMVPKVDTIFLPMFGIDNNGYLYLKELSGNPSKRLYARYALETGEKQMASMPYPYDGQYTNLYPSVSPNGTIYFVAYSNEDLSVPPKIFKCRFPE